MSPPETACTRDPIRPRTHVRAAMEQTEAELGLGNPPGDLPACRSQPILAEQRPEFADAWNSAAVEARARRGAEPEVAREPRPRPGQPIRCPARGPSPYCSH